jgi:hypothetical protein
MLRHVIMFQLRMETQPELIHCKGYGDEQQQ